jgi:hypothetical protein
MLIWEGRHLFDKTDFVFFGNIPSSGIAGSYHMVVLFLIFKGASILLFILAVLAYSLINKVYRFPLCHTFSNTGHRLSF